MERQPLNTKVLGAALGLSLSLMPLVATGQQCSPCDWNADGRLDCDDPTLFQNAWSADRCNGTRLADFNQDGVVDQWDTIAFVNCWNAGNPGCTADPVPANDRCANAQVLTGPGPFSFRTCRASDTSGEGTGRGPGCGASGLCACGGPFCDRFMRYDVWFVWTAPATDLVTISTAGLADGTDTALAVYLGPALCQPWANVDYYSDTGPLGEEAEVTFPGVAGQTYIIQLGVGRGAWSGPACAPLDLPSALGWHGQFSITIGKPVDPCAGPVVNDSCSAPMTLPASATGTYAFGAATDGPVHAGCFGPGSPDIADDVWFEVVASGTTLDIATTTPGLDTRIAVYESGGGACGNLAETLVACGDDQPGGLVQARVVLATTPGHAYLVRVGRATPSPAGGGCFDLAIGSPSQPPCPPPLPGRAQAYVLTGSPSGAAWSWRVQTSAASLGNLNVPGVAPGSPLSALRDAVVDSINNAGCFEGISARPAAGPGIGFVVSTGGDEPPQLWVGPAGGPVSCRVSEASGCSFNPDIALLKRSGADCNGNGNDDAVDIAAGTSGDLNRNGAPDECEKVVCPDWDGNGITNSTDVSNFINDWFADQVNGTLVTEINGDGVSNSTDVSDFINAYFAAPAACTP